MQYKKAEAKRIRDEHEAIWPGLAAKFKIPVSEQADALAQHHRQMDRAADILGYRPGAQHAS